MSDVILGEFSTDLTPPEVTSPSPGNGVTGVAKDSVVAFTITDAEAGVDFDSLLVTVGGTTVYDWDGVGVPEDGFQTPTYDGTITDLGGGAWRFELSTHPDFASYVTVAVTVDGQDLAPLPNIITPTYSWSFETADYEAPYVDTGWSPTGTGVPVGQNIEFDLKDDGVGVDITSVVVTVGGVEAYNWDGVGVDPNAGFKSGFQGGASAVTGTPAAYHFVIDPLPVLDEYTVYEVIVTGADLVGA